MRFQVTKVLEFWLKANKPQISRVAIVGGSSRDPELAILRNLYPFAKIEYFGIENTHKDIKFQKFDLNVQKHFSEIKFDFVICSQVLEHLWNHENAFAALSNMTETGGFLWINVPASNFPHGSPYYFSAGFSSEYIAKNLSCRNFSICINKNIGSKRYYFMTHILREWVTEEEHNHPVSGYKFKPGTFLGVTRKYLFELPGRVLSLFFSKEITESIEFATESVVLGQLKAPVRL